MFFVIFFLKCNIVNIKIVCFLLAHFNSFFNNYLFFKFISKCQKEILRCTPPSSHVCDFTFHLGDKKVVAGHVRQVVILYSNDCMGICLGGCLNRFDCSIVMKNCHVYSLLFSITYLNLAIITRDSYYIFLRVFSCWLGIILIYFSGISA